LEIIIIIAHLTLFYVFPSRSLISRFSIRLHRHPEECFAADGAIIVETISKTIFLYLDCLKLTIDKSKQKI